MKKYLQLVLCGMSLLGCNKTNQNQELMFKEQPIEPTAISQISSDVSYKLEDLCDTEIYEKNIILNVYIEDSNVLWDYHKHKNEIFGYVRDFFKEQQINCRIVYSNKQFNRFNKSDEFGIEIVDSDVKMKERYAKLVTGLDFEPKENPLILDKRGYAATRAGISLINGCWEEFKEAIRDEEMTIQEVENQYDDEYKGMTVKEYLFKGYASNIAHELLHCMILFHPETIVTERIGKYSNGIPNIMSYEIPKFTEKNSLGYCLTPLQQKLIHSFIEGNNTYKAFLDSQRDLDVFIENLKKEN